MPAPGSVHAAISHPRSHLRRLILHLCPESRLAMAVAEAIPKPLPTALGSHAIQLGRPCSLLRSVGAGLHYGPL